MAPLGVPVEPDEVVDAWRAVDPARIVALDAEVRASQRRRRLVDAALTKGIARPWDFQPFRDASRQYVRNGVDLDETEGAARFPRVARP